MGSRIITFRVPDDLYEEFGKKCEEDEQTASEKLRHFIDEYLYPPKAETSAITLAPASEEVAPAADEVEEAEPATLEMLSARVGALENSNGQMGNTLDGILERGDTLAAILERVEALETLRIAAEPEAEAIPKPEAEAVSPAEVVAGHEVKEIKEGGPENKTSVFDGWLFTDGKPKEEK